MKELQFPSSKQTSPLLTPSELPLSHLHDDRVRLAAALGLAESFVTPLTLNLCVCVCVCVCERERERERLCVNVENERVHMQ